MTSEALSSRRAVVLKPSELVRPSPISSPDSFDRLQQLPLRRHLEPASLLILDLDSSLDSDGERGAVELSIVDERDDSFFGPDQLVKQRLDTKGGKAEFSVRRLPFNSPPFSSSL